LTLLFNIFNFDFTSFKSLIKPFASKIPKALNRYSLASCGDELIIYNVPMTLYVLASYVDASP
jgi:hypothetical protein